MKTKLLTLLLCIRFTISSFSQTIVIPDANFEQILINIGIDSDGAVNGQILTSDIDGVTATDVLNIQLKETVPYKIMTINSQVLQFGKLEIGENRILLDDVSDGLYFVKVSSEYGSSKKTN